MLPTLTPQAATLRFYAQHAKEYFSQTAHLDVHCLYAPFLREIRQGGRILDAGCGSGRDTKAFLERGYSVTAIDASPEMARLATSFTNQECAVMRIQDLSFHEEFDGIWASASLLHLPRAQIHEALLRLHGALKTTGILYISLKEGRGEGVSRDGRFFCYYSRASFRQVLHRLPLRELQFWESPGRKPDGSEDLWLNFLLKKARSIRVRGRNAPL